MRLRLRLRAACTALCGALLPGLLLLLLIGWPAPVRAAEAITRWHSAVTVGADGTLRVRETIRVRAEGQQIVHGIERDFPVRFTDWRGVRRMTSFNVEAATLDGQAAQYELLPVADGVRLRLGSATTLLANGEHEFVLDYTSAHQLYKVDGQAVLYWNVTGNAWELPIDSASATVRLPRALRADEARLEAFTGLAGSTAQNAAAELRDGLAQYATTQPLPAGWGLTLVLHFPLELAAVDDREFDQPNVSGVAPLAGDGGAGGSSGGAGSGKGSARPGAPKWLMESWPVLLLLAFLVFNGLRGGGSGGGPDSGYRTYRNASHRSGSGGGGSFRGRSGGGGGGGGGRGW
jgi:hypothetical protein